MKIFKNLALMYRQNFQSFPQKCSDCSRHESQKSKYVQIIIRPPKNPIFFRQGLMGLKQLIFGWAGHLASKTAKGSYRIVIKSFGIHPVCITCLGLV